MIKNLKIELNKKYIINTKENFYFMFTQYDADSDSYLCEYHYSVKNWGWVSWGIAMDYMRFVEKIGE